MAVTVDQMVTTGTIITPEATPAIQELKTTLNPTPTGMETPRSRL